MIFSWFQIFISLHQHNINKLYTIVLIYLGHIQPDSLFRLSTVLNTSIKRGKDKLPKCIFRWFVSKLKGQFFSLMVLVFFTGFF